MVDLISRFDLSKPVSSLGVVESIDFSETLDERWMSYLRHVFDRLIFVQRPSWRFDSFSLFGKNRFHKKIHVASKQKRPADIYFLATIFNAIFFLIPCHDDYLRRGSPEGLILSWSGYATSIVVL